MGGTHFAHLWVKQRDAPPLNNGTRPVSHYNNSGFGPFLEVPISDAGSSAWLAMMPQPSKLAPLVFYMFGNLRNRKFLVFVMRCFLSLLLRVPTLKHNKNRGLGQPAFSTIFCLKTAFLECTNWGLTWRVFCVPLVFFFFSKCAILTLISAKNVFFN